MKKVISLVLSFVILVTSTVGIGITVSASDLPVSGKCGTNVFWQYDTKFSTVTLFGDGAVDDYDVGSQFWIDITTGEKLDIKNLIIKEGITSVGKCAFYGCTGLLSVSLPDSLNELGFSAFGNCFNLETINIPANLNTSFGYSGLQYLYNYKEISVDSDNEQYTSVDGVLFNKDKTELIKYPQNKTDKIYTVPDTVKNIYSKAFYENHYLESVEIPSSVKEIGMDAFGNCSSLISIDLNKIEKIDDYAFEKCNNLKTVTVPKTVSYIGENPFRECKSLESINVDSENPNYCIFDGALCDKAKTVLYSYPCKSLNTEFTVPSSVSSLPSFIFAYCDNLKSVSVPASVTTIDSVAFFRCNNTIEFNIDDENPNYTFEKGLILNKTKDSIICATFGCDVSNYVIPDYIKVVEIGAFSGCKSLSAVTVSKNVEKYNKGFIYSDTIKNVYVDSENPYFTSVDGVLFSKDKTELLYYPDGRAQTHYSVPASVNKINAYAFVLTEYLQSVSIPATVTNANKAIFFESNIKKVFFGGSAKQWNDDLDLKIWHFFGVNICFNNYCANLPTVEPQSEQSDIKNTGNSAVKITSAKITKLNGKKKAIGVHWSKANNVDGYQIQVATDKKIKKNKKTATVKKQKTTKTTIKKLKAKKKYYVRIRTYKTVNGKKLYSSWSKIKSVKTK